MNTDTTPLNLADEMADDFASIAEQHRMAAHHFKLAARHHMAAADADENGDPGLTARHAFLAYRHQLAATQYAEIAVLDDDNLDDLDDFHKDFDDEEGDGIEEEAVSDTQ